ncbi:MAG: hypothetical protein NG740_02690 [Omnitrophica bacterium]|nr:hypothetical protein [Candidatus Omnitrophota bacterium]
MKILTLIITALLLAHASAFAINPAEVDIMVTVNKKPVVGPITLNGGPGINQGVTLEVTASATDGNSGDILNYRFKLEGAGQRGWNTWSTVTFISYELEERDIGLNVVKVEVRDSLETVQAAPAEIYVFRTTVEVPQ